MSINYVGASEPDTGDKKQTSSIKLKLRIALIFRTQVSSTQCIIADNFRNGKINFDGDGEDFPEELSGSIVRFQDKDEGSGEYKIADKTFVVDEGSPKAMQRLSKDIDNYVKEECANRNIEKAVLNFFIPSISNYPIIPTLFLHSFPPSCIVTNSQTGILQKIDNVRSSLLFFGFDIIYNFSKATLEEEKYRDTTLDKEHIQLFALLCHYTYFYLDFFELKDWSFFKKTKGTISRYDVIEDFFKEPTKESNPSLWRKVGTAIAKSLFLPFEIAESAFSILFNYNGHLKNRIFKRIKEVVDIVDYDFDPDKYKQGNAEILYRKIQKVLDKSLEEYNKNKTPISLYDYFDICGYWDYLREGREKPSNVEVLAKKWKVKENHKHTGFVSGFGSLLFTDGKDYIYCFKGTDFDSYGRDWLQTNLLQGLTGLSIQHIRAVIDAKKIDKEVGSKGNVWFVGHSLGGGLASAATIATKGREGVTFNAAGLNVIGVKLNQLINNPAGVLHPSQSWSRVFPYRIKGEILDFAQNFIFRYLTIGTYERGYGKKSVEIELTKDGTQKKCIDRHGINNFLLKEVLNKLQPFDQVKEDKTNKIFNKDNNKIVSVEFLSKQALFKSNFE